MDPAKRHRVQGHRGVFYRERKDGGKTYLVSTGGGRFVPAQTLRDALALQGELRSRKARGERVMVNDRTTFAQLAEEWFDAKSPRLRGRTASYYRMALDTVLIPRFGAWRVSAIDAEAIAQLARDLEREGLHAVHRNRPARPLGRSSIDNYLKPLQGILRLAVRRRIIADNPFLHLTEDDRPQASRKRAHEWTQRELDALIEAAEEIARRPESRYDYAPILRITSRLGLRIGEVLGLQWQDFDRKLGTLSVKRQWLRVGEYGPPKTRASERTIYLPDDLRRELIDLQLASKFSQDGDPVFASSNGTPLGHRNVTRRGWEPARDLACLKGVSFHDLRHAAASRLIAARLDDDLVAAQMGHRDSTVTRRVYSHLFDAPEKVQAVRDALAIGGSG